MITAMDVNYFVLMVLHVIGALLHLRMFVNCFKEKYAIVSTSFMFLMMAQCFCQLQFLALNVKETTKVFGNEQGQEFCTYNSCYMISCASFMNYFPLILAGCRCTESYRTVLAVYETSSVALMLVIGNVLVVCFSSIEKLCVFRVALALPCMFLLVVMLWVFYHGYVRTWRDESGFGQSLVTILVLLGFVSIINLEVIRHGSLQNIEFFQRIFFLYVQCIIVGVLLPLLFQRVLDSIVLLLATEKELTDSISNI